MPTVYDDLSMPGSENRTAEGDLTDLTDERVTTTPAICKPASRFA